MDKITLLILLGIACVGFAVFVHYNNAEYERKIRQKDRLIQKKDLEITRLKKELIKNERDIIQR